MGTDHQQEIARSEEKSPSYRWLIVGLLLLNQEGTSLPFSGVGMLLPAMRKDLGFGVAQAGVLSSLLRFPQAILGIPASLLLVRFRPKWVYFLAILGDAAASFLVARSPGFIILAFAFAFHGVGMVLKQIPDTLLKRQWIAKKEFATVMGITQGAMALGSSGIIMILPFLLIALGSWRNLYIIAGSILLFLSAVWVVFAKERITAEYQDGMSSRDGQAPLKGVLKRKEFPLIGFAKLGSGLTYSTTMLFVPTFLLEERGIALSTIGIIVGLLPLGGVFANLTIGFISDKIGLRKPTIWPAGLLEPFLYAALIFSPLPVVALSVISFTIGYVAWAPFPALGAIPFELPNIKPSEIVVGNSLIMTITTLGGLIAVPIVGYLAEALGSLRTALLITCFFPWTVAIAGFILPETGIKAHSKI
ncbi:MAG: MFS transporter [Chloroflexi bacterium]|nr:MFS transporter [Chloroflexota bacterium]